MVVKKSEYEQLFLSEAQELISSANNVLVSLEKDPADSDLLHELFRQSHTLKSMAQTVGYEDVAKLTHSMEATLTLLRSGELSPRGDIVELLFSALDILNKSIEGTYKGQSRLAGIDDMIKRFELINSAGASEEKQDVHAKSRPTTDMVDDSGKERGEAREAKQPSSFSEVQSIRVPLSQLDSLLETVGELVINRVRLLQVSQAVDNSFLEESVAQMSRLVSSLQDQVMQVRLVPLAYIFTP